MPTLTTIHDFTNTPDGSTPQSTLIGDGSGDLFGTTTSGGANGAGAVFKLTPDGSGGYTGSIVYSFTGGPDGSAPRPA